MTFRVVEMLQDLGPDRKPHSRTVKRTGIAGHADALAEVEALARRLPVHGHDGEQGWWWGREQEHGGVNHVFFVEGEPVQRDVNEAIVATTEDPEIRDGTELVRLHGIPDGWGGLEGDAVQVTVADGRMATLMAIGPEHPSVFHWGYDSTFSHLARLDRVSGTILRVTLLSRLPER